MFKRIQKIHFVGIGGAGMSGIAEVLLNLGYKVSGSDLKETEVTDRLRNMGAKIYQGHSDRNVGNVHAVVTSSAVRPNNPEVVIARKKKIPVVPRIEMLSEIARLKYTVAVAGTHGKTTTTSMVTSVLQKAGFDPTFIVGGRINHLESGARLGTGDFLVAEADESDGSFLKLSPTVALVTNIDNDHLDYYKSFRSLKQAFITFANRVPFYGFAVLCVDDPGVKSILPDLKRRVITYGFSREAEFSAIEVTAGGSGTSYTLTHNGEKIGKVSLGLYGRHNVLNSLAACACAMELQIPFESISHSMEDFENVGRRLERRGQKSGAIWMDDYGHHPTEIRAALSALREKFPDKKLVVLFQPHRYTRTKLLLKDFGSAFKEADELLLLPIYAAGERPISGVSSAKLLPGLRKNRINVKLLKSKENNFLKHIAPNSIFLTLGAGDVWKIGQRIFAPVD